MEESNAEHSVVVRVIWAAYCHWVQNIGLNKWRAELLDNFERIEYFAAGRCELEKVFYHVIFQIVPTVLPQPLWNIFGSVNPQVQLLSHLGLKIGLTTPFGSDDRGIQLYHTRRYAVDLPIDLSEARSMLNFVQEEAGEHPQTV